MGTEIATVPTLVKTIKTLIEKGDHAAGKSEQFYIAAGQHLKTLKERKPDNTPWAEYVQAKVGISKTRAYQLIAIADGRTTVADTRAETAERVRKVREANRPLRSGYSSSSVLTTTNEDDEPDEEEYEKLEIEHSRAAFMIRAGEVIRAAQLPKNCKPDRKMLASAQAAEAAWTKIVTNIKESLK